MAHKRDRSIKSQIRTLTIGDEGETNREYQSADQTVQAEMIAIRSALDKGEKSGLSARCPEEIINTVIARKLKNNKLSVKPAREISDSTTATDER